MTNTDQQYMQKPITNLAEAEAYVRQLHADGLLYHFEDDAAEVGNCRSGVKWERCFTDEEALVLNARADELCALNWRPMHEDVFDFVLKLTT